ncbi:MAG: hypothetical protein RIC95_05635 [Vicingaceae bacterium]
MRALLLALTIFGCMQLKAGRDDVSVGARANALGNISILHQDFWSAENNPAGLGFQKDWGAGISYESPYLINNLSYRSAVFAYPTSNGAFGLSVGQFGYSLYNENKIGVSYGQRLSKTFALGVQLNYLSTQIGEGYGSNSALSGNIGLMALVSDELTVAAVVVNPNRAKLSTFQDERYPTLLKLGAAYEFSSKVSLMSEVMKDIDYNAIAKVGIEYKAIDILHFRLGYASDPALSTFGFGLHYNDFTLDFASGFHSTLGFTPQFSLSYTPADKSRK